MPEIASEARRGVQGTKAVHAGSPNRARALDRTRMRLSNPQKNYSVLVRARWVPAVLEH